MTRILSIEDLIDHLEEAMVNGMNDHMPTEWLKENVPLEEGFGDTINVFISIEGSSILLLAK